jgi:DNA-binding NtrC family response regulator
MGLEDGNILIVDDNPDILKTLKFILGEEFSRIKTLKDPNRLHNALRNESFDLVLLDMNFTAGINTGNEGFYWMQEILNFDPDLPVILITAYGDIDMAVKAIKQGAVDFIQKPFDPPRLLSTVRSAYRLRCSRKEVATLKGKQKTISQKILRRSSPIIGESDKIKSVIETVRKVAPTDANVLLTGESGTGKELIAKEIHNLSQRSDELFIPVDMGTISDSLFESEMFGHKRGSFTNAIEDRKGWFETASGGTLFLDEISNLSLAMQAKLLSAIQNRRICPVGSTNEVEIDVRIITATNKNLQTMIGEGLFREDLFFRINTVIIDLPPLRERSEDIFLLADYFLRIYSKKYEKPGLRFSNKAFSLLKQHKWQGNIREIRHAIENAVIMCDNNSIEVKDMRLISTNIDDTKVISSGNYRLDEIEKVAIDESLKRNNGNIARTASELGITRKTLYSKIEKYGI